MPQSSVETDLVGEIVTFYERNGTGGLTEFLTGRIRAIHPVGDTLVFWVELLAETHQRRGAFDHDIDGVAGDVFCIYGRGEYGAHVLRIQSKAKR